MSTEVQYHYDEEGYGYDENGYKFDENGYVYDANGYPIQDTRYATNDPDTIQQKQEDESKDEITELSTTHIAKIGEELGKTSDNGFSWCLAKLYKVENGEWVESGFGACILVRGKDSQYSIQLYDIESYKKLFYQNIQKISYEADEDIYFQTWSNENEEQFGINFFNEREARDFGGKVKKTLQTLQSGNNTQPMKTINIVKPKKKKGFFGRLFGGQKKEKKKIVIGAPTGFKHVSHMGFDPNTGFDLKNIPEEWKAFFQNNNVSDKDLENPEMAKVIMETVAEVMSEGKVAPNDQPKPPPRRKKQQSNEEQPPEIDFDEGLAEEVETTGQKPYQSKHNGNHLAAIQGFSKEDLADSKSSNSGALPSLSKVGTKGGQDLASMLGQRLGAIRKAVAHKEQQQEEESEDDEWNEGNF